MYVSSQVAGRATHVLLCGAETTCAELLDALELFFVKNRSLSPYMTYFAFEPVVAAAEDSSDARALRIHTASRETAKTILLVNSWDDPVHDLDTWNAFAVGCSENLDIVLSNQQLASFHDKIYYEVLSIDARFAGVDLGRASGASDGASAPPLAAEVLAVANARLGGLLRSWASAAAKDLADHVTQTSAQDDATALKTLNNVAIFFSAQLKFDEARELFVANLGRQESLLGCEHPDALSTVMNLAGVLMKQADYRGASELLKRCFASWEASRGLEAEETLKAGSNLAVALKELGEADEAEALFKRLLDAYKRLLGPTHRDTLTTGHNLANLYLKMQRLEEARALFESSLESQGLELGLDHQDTLLTTNNLAAVHLHLRNYVMSNILYERALLGYKKLLGPVHPSVLITMGNMASASYLQGRFEAAKAQFEAVLASSRLSLVEPAEVAKYRLGLQLCEEALQSREKSELCSGESEVIPGIPSEVVPSTSEPAKLATAVPSPELSQISVEKELPPAHVASPKHETLANSGPRHIFKTRNYVITGAVKSFLDQNYGFLANVCKLIVRQCGDEEWVSFLFNVLITF